MMWNQGSRALWVKCGDRNTKFFHETASKKCRKNRINGLCDNEGRWREDQEEVEGIILEYFKEIYNTNYPTDFGISLGVVDRRVSDEMNDVLLKEFREEEVWYALKQIIQQNLQAWMVCLLYSFKNIRMLWALRL